MNQVDFLKNNLEIVARHYDETPDQLDRLSAEDIHNLRVFAQKLFSYSQLSGDYYFDFVEDKPYSFTTIEEVVKHWERTGAIKVSTLDNTSTLFGPVYNLLFRASHDWVHLVTDRGFTYKEEIEVWDYTARIFSFFKIFSTPEKFLLFQKIIRSEIVYQAAYKEFFGKFYIGQKIILDDPPGMEQV